jgi:hypothetical protein
LSPDAPYTVPFGTSIVLDGAIGAEWHNALFKPTTLRGNDGERFPADVFLLHDEAFLYIAVRLATSHHYSGDTLYAWVLFDNGDEAIFSPGDNLILIPESDGQLRTSGLDYHFPVFKRRVLDDVENAQGVGRWNPTERAYEFEIRIDLHSGDPYDVVILPGQPTAIKLGCEVIDRGGTKRVEAEAPAFSLVVAAIE